MKIEIEKHEYELASRVGFLRERENVEHKKGDSLDYRQGYGTLNSLTRHRLGALGEILVAKSIGLDARELRQPDWIPFYMIEQKHLYEDLADLLGFIEVRRADKMSSKMTLKTKDLKIKDGVTVQIYVPYSQKQDGSISLGREATILGWNNTQAAYDSEDSVPGFWPEAKQTGARQIATRRPMDEFPMDRVLTKEKI